MLVKQHETLDKFQPYIVWGRRIFETVADLKLSCVQWYSEHERGFAVSPGCLALYTHHGDGVWRRDLYGRQHGEVRDVGHDVDEGDGRHGDPDGTRQVPTSTRIHVNNAVRQMLLNIHNVVRQILVKNKIASRDYFRRKKH